MTPSSRLSRQPHRSDGAGNERVLVAGWFSFEGMGATAGDLMSRDVLVSWLAEAGFAHEIASVPPYGAGVDWREIDPRRFTHAVFVCGPFGNGPPVDALLERFRNCRWFGVNLSMLQPLECWNPFEALFERDSSRLARPDLSMLSEASPRTVAGLILIHPQPEYGERDRHEAANASLVRALDVLGVTAIPIDTNLDANAGQLTTALQIEALIARMDFVATTRLHGLVLALKNGVPAVAVDPVAGGAKIRRQAEALGWPVVRGVDGLSEVELVEMCTFCMSAEARAKAAACRGAVGQRLSEVRQAFLAAIARPPSHREA